MSAARDAVTADVQDALEERVRPERAPETGHVVDVRKNEGPGSTVWWWIRISQMSIRINLQEASRKKANMSIAKNWANIDVGWIGMVRTFAAYIRKKDESFPRVRQGQQGVLDCMSMRVPQLRRIAKVMAHNVNDSEDAPYAWHPPEWRKGLEEVRGQFR